MKNIKVVIAIALIIGLILGFIVGYTKGSADVIHWGLTKTMELFQANGINVTIDMAILETDFKRYSNQIGACWTK